MSFDLDLTKEEREAVTVDAVRERILSTREPWKSLWRMVVLKSGPVRKIDEYVVDFDTGLKIYSVSSLEQFQSQNLTPFPMNVIKVEPIRRDEI